MSDTEMDADKAAVQNLAGNARLAAISLSGVRQEAVHKALDALDMLCEGHTFAEAAKGWP